MFERIDAKVSVAGVYAQGRFAPKKIRWGKKILLVDEITLVSEIRDGAVKQRLYSFRSGSEVYRLLFNRETEIWILEEVWVE